MPTLDASSKLAFESYISNTLDPIALKKRWIAGIIGDKPSTYAKSPSLWNAAFRDLGLDATFFPWDVTPENLKPLVAELRRTPNIVGFSVTVPYKIDILPLLDELDPKAALIGAVNTVRRTSEGKLIGFNTDAQGGLDSLLRCLPGQTAPVIDSLAGKRVVLLGAGGAARAMAFFMADAIGPKGRLILMNRDQAKAQSLAAQVMKAYGNAEKSDLAAFSQITGTVDLVINASTLGQSGIRRLADGLATCLEPYTPLGSANPAQLKLTDYPDTESWTAAWFRASRSDIEANTSQTLDAIAKLSAHTIVFDIIYSPIETRLLSWARLNGKRTLNGKAMNIAQAADGFANKVMQPHLTGDANLYESVFRTMASIW